MKFHHLRSKLLLTVAVLVIGSGLIISLLETNRFGKILQQAAVTQGEYLSRAVALEATNKILTNDLIELQNLLNHQLHSNPSVSYLFISKNGHVMAHTFSDGIPMNLVNFNSPLNSVRGSFKRITTDTGENFLDIAWPILSGKAGVLRIGLSEKQYRSQVLNMWFQMTGITLGILILALGISFFFIRRVTRPLSALAEAAKNINEADMDFKLDTTGRDEVGSLTNSFKQMVHRMSERTQHLEKNAIELDRAYHQIRSSFEIIQQIGARSNLRDVSSYLITKFHELVACSDLALFIFATNQKSLFTFSGSNFRILERGTFEDSFSVLRKMEGINFVKKEAVNSLPLPDTFQSSNRLAAFPIYHEKQFIGAMMVSCPDSCQCDVKELKVIHLILNHSSGVIKRALMHEEEMLHIQNHIEVATEYCGIVGKDPKMQAIYKLIEDIAPSDTTVLIQGESGTGKELVASAIHLNSLRRNKPFVVINCSAYPANLLESELFGHEKGAFTGAVRQKAGRFEQADGGTVFLDEIGEIPPIAQIKLLRVIQTQKFERIGGEQTLAVNVRIIAATNKDLLREVKQGRFREDLYYRLNVIPIHLPPLNKRRNDIPLQARYFLKRYAAEQGKDITEFSREAMRLLLDCPWPGNVRELENSIEAAVVLARGKRIEISDFPSALLRDTCSTIETASPGTIGENEARLLKEVLEECNWNKKEAAQRLGISRNTLYRKLKKYQINTPSIH
ncbi:MAG: sigma 54-interacting transcriptional regulator [Deltaproteobacteria bacterium]|nr:sigma 54-interacting transcriptional regulator [Deltaproteobacteria bacterium]